MSNLKGFSRIVVFGAEYCGFCKRAQSLLSKAQVNFSYLDAEENTDMLLSWQKKENYHKIPMVFIDEKFIGGFSELSKMVKEKQIDLS